MLLCATSISSVTHAIGYFHNDVIRIANKVYGYKVGSNAHLEGGTLDLCGLHQLLRVFLLEDTCTVLTR